MRMATVLALQQRKTVRVLQCLNRATVTHQEYGEALLSAKPKTSAWKRRDKPPFLLSRSWYARPRPAVSASGRNGGDRDGGRKKKKGRESGGATRREREG